MKKKEKKALFFSKGEGGQKAAGLTPTRSQNLWEKKATIATFEKGKVRERFARPRPIQPVQEGNDESDPPIAPRGKRLAAVFGRGIAPRLV